MPERNGKRDHPVAHGYLRDDMLDQVGRGLRHAAAATGGAKPSAFTGERHQLLLGAFPTPQAQKPMG